MSMITQLVRLRAAELAEVTGLLATDPDGAYDYVTDRADAMDTDKAWGGLEFLLARVESPVDVISGGTPLTDEQWGYDSPRLLTPDEVAAAARFLDDTPFGRLEAHYEPAQLIADDVYPAGLWTEAWAAEYLRDAYTRLVAFFHAAAAAGDNVVIWMA